MRDLPGFFYDEEKGKYFPIHLKEAYVKDKKALAKEQEKNMIKESDKTTDLYKFIGNSSVKFDSISERISRIQVNEIVWRQNKVQIDPERDLYYRYNWENGKHIIQHVKISTGEEVKTLQVENGNAILKFGVVYDKSDNRCFHYFVFGDQVNLERELIIVEQESFHFWQKLPPYYPNFDVIYTDGWFYFCNEERILELTNGHDFITKERLPYDFDYLTSFPETGVIYVYKGGLIEFADDPKKKFKIKKSSAKRIHYHEEKLLVLTHHGQLIILNLKTGKTEEIFKIKDFDFPDCRFEDLLIEAKGKVTVIGYKNQKEIVFLNWIDKKVIKKLTLDKAMDSLQLSNDLSNLYIQTH